MFLSIEYFKLKPKVKSATSPKTRPTPKTCSGCRVGKNKPHFFDFRKLTNWLEKGVFERDCDESGEMVNFISLLENNFVFEKRLEPRQPVVLKDVKYEKPAPLAFFSYSKMDIEYLKTFQKHLRPLERSGKIRLWDDRKIRPGEEWDDEIKTALATADIIFLLLSPDFLATDYVDKTEIAEAMRRHETGEAKVIPIKIRPCSWKNTLFSKLQGLPRKDKIISTATNLDAAWLEVLVEIEEEIAEKAR